jgi:tetratricopeptide (TPR) repeat protein
MSDDDDFVDWDPDQLVRMAESELREDKWREASELLRRALTVDEDHARAHAMLALALLIPKRYAGAESEARRALALQSGSPYCHYVLAAVLFARGRRIDQAWESCHVALGGGVDHETNVRAHVLGAQIRAARGEHEPARALLERALQIAPNHADARVAFARLELAAGRPAEAARHADEALRIRSTDIAANVIAGKIDLAAGDVAAAERHARFALLQDSADAEALRLWAAIRSHRNRALGTLWRAAVWITTRDGDQQVGLLVGSYILVQLAMILANAAGLAGLQSKLVWLWAGLVLALYWGPAGLQRLLANDLEQPEPS